MEDNYAPEADEVNRAELDNRQDLLDEDEVKNENDMFGTGFTGSDNPNPDYPISQAKENIFSFFKNLLTIPDTTRVSNIDPRKELGSLQFTIRTNKYLGLVGDTLGDGSFSGFFGGQSEIITSTAMSKNGWMPELVVSQKRFTSRAIRPIKANAPSAVKSFLGFGKKQPSEVST